MCFSERTRRWNSTCLLSCLFFSEWKVFRRERTTSPQWTIYCPSLGIPHDPGMGMDSGKGRSSELTLAVLSWLSDKTESAAPKLYVRVFSKKHFSSFSRSGFWPKKKKKCTNCVISKANKSVQRPGASSEAFSLKQKHTCGEIKPFLSSSSIVISCSVKGISVRCISVGVRVRKKLPRTTDNVICKTGLKMFEQWLFPPDADLCPE